MTTQECKEILASEGFPHIYEWHDESGVIYPPHAHKDNVTIFIIEGSVTFDFSGTKKTVSAGERFDVLPGAEHTAVVGTSGCTYVVGEMIEGDS